MTIMSKLLYELLSNVGTLTIVDHIPTGTASRVLLQQRIHREQQIQTSCSLPSKHLVPKRIKIRYHNVYWSMFRYINKSSNYFAI